MSESTKQELRERIDELETKVEELQELVDDTGGVTRRSALQALAALGGGSLLGAAGSEAVGNAAASPSTTDGDGDVGTPSNPVDIFADGVDIGGPSDFDHMDTDASTIPARIQSPDSNIALGLQLQDPDAANGENGYSTILGFYNGPPNNEQIGQLSADNTNEMSIYTRTLPLSDTATEGDFAKRLNFSAGSQNSIIRMKSPEYCEVNLQSQNSNPNLKWVQAGQDRMGVFYSTGSDDFRFNDYVNSNVALRYAYADEAWNFAGSKIRGLREISNPVASDLLDQEWAWDATNSRWLYKDDGGTAHYFTPDGTL